MAKKALPSVGGALGSLVPIPGVGTALGSAVGNALKAEFEGLDPEDQEFEMARRCVRVAGTAAQQALQIKPGVEPQAAARAAVMAAIRRHVPGISREVSGAKAGSTAIQGNSGGGAVRLGSP